MCLLPVYGGYRRGLLLTRDQFLLAASGSFSQAIDDGLYTSCPLSARHQHCYSSLQCFCFIQLITYRGIYNIDRIALSSVFHKRIRAWQKSPFAYPRIATSRSIQLFYPPDHTQFPLPYKVWLSELIKSLAAKRLVVLRQASPLRHKRRNGQEHRTCKVLPF